MAKWALLALLIAACAYDLRYRRIPNWLCIAGFLAGVVWNLHGSFTGAGVAILVYLPLWMLRAAGAGDVKLMAAAGSLLGWMGWLGVFAFSAVINGIWALGIVATKGRSALKRRKPMAPAVLIGAILWLWANR